MTPTTELPTTPSQEARAAPRRLSPLDLTLLLSVAAVVVAIALGASGLLG